MLIAVLTVSDRCSLGEAENRSGPEVVRRLKEIFPEAKLFATDVVPDDVLCIQEIISDWCASGVDLIVSTGGTGFSPRDVTPEAVGPLLERRADAMAATMVMQGMQKTPLALLSRPVCGIRGHTMIVTLPGSVKAVGECLDILRPAFPHAMNLLCEEQQKIQQVHCDCEGPPEAIVLTDDSAVEGGRSDASGNGSIVGRPRRSPYPMVEVADAIRTIQTVADARCSQFPQTLSVYDVHRRTCAEDITATSPFPPFRASTMDGYAVRCSGNTTLRVRPYAATAGARPADYRDSSSEELSSEVEESSVRPSSPSPSQDNCVKADEPMPTDLVDEEWCVRISTGAVVPDGADAVVRVEDTELIEKDEATDQELRIRLLREPVSGQNIRHIGCDIPEGSVLLKKGDRIDAAAVGRLVMAGVESVTVLRLPKVGVLSTGDELLGHYYSASNRPDAASCWVADSRRIRDSNRPMLLALLREIGVPCVDLGIAIDTYEVLDVKLRTAFRDFQCNIVITTGGVSMGEKDLLKDTLIKLGYTIHFGRVNAKPGKPTTFASSEINPLVFALPGNPASAFVMFQLFVRAALRELGADRPLRSSKAELKIPQPLKLDYRPEYLRGKLIINPNNQRVEAKPSEMQQSSSLLSCRDADILICLPARVDGRTHITPGEVVDIIWL